MANTPTARIVKLRSPFNGEVVPMEFVPGQTPTLDALLLAGFTREDDESVAVKAAKRHAEDTARGTP